MSRRISVSEALQTGLKEITRNGNWCSVDELEGVPLRDGENLIVIWPEDGRLEQIAVLVKSRTIVLPDHGHDFLSTESHAFYQTQFRGIPVLVPLVGLMAQRA